MIPMQNKACVCSESFIQESYLNADFVGIIEVLDIHETDSLAYGISIQINELFKGDSTVQRLTVSSGSKNGAIMTSCDPYLEPGEKWVVFAKKFDGKLHFGMCSGSNKLAKFQDWELDLLRHPEKINDQVFLREEEVDRLPQFQEEDTIALQNGYQSSNGETGMVLFTIQINSKGEILYIKPAGSSNKKLEEEALAIVKTLKTLNPAIKNGDTVGVVVTICIKFVS
jgi:hypothetical protein